ncbi:hypothetical protein IX332_001918 [Porphyromonas levii]|nr:hypothetical protein [Porphyromonas levii]MBR8760608.1 hypothetical protein [Porphyromonas levii]MBR8766620.1 hypothetical protein [Porphyromonas levii]
MYNSRGGVFGVVLINNTHHLKVLLTFSLWLIVQGGAVKIHILTKTISA